MLVNRIKGYEKPITTISVFLVVLVMVSISLIFWTERRYNQGYNDGLTTGRRDIVEAILISVAKDKSVTIKQGEDSVTLVVGTTTTSQ